MYKESKVSNTYTKIGQEITLSVEFEKAIEYITNVVKCQERFLEVDEFYRAYQSMNWAKPLGYVDFCEAYICVIKEIKENQEKIRSGRITIL